MDLLQCDNKSVDTVQQGTLACIRTQLTKAELKGGMRVFLVHTQDETVSAERTAEN